MDGTTVEINNTDAEGRLTLGDAITYARTRPGARSTAAAQQGSSAGRSAPACVRTRLGN
jgi:hypothetical protein